MPQTPEQTPSRMADAHKKWYAFKRTMPGKKNLKRKTLGKGAVTWINVENPTQESLARLKKRYPFLLDIDLQDCLPPFQRPKLLARTTYLFMVLLFPVYDQKRRAVHQYEVDFFIGKNFLITSHAGTHSAIAELVGECEDDSGHCMLRSTTDPLRLAHDVVHGLTVSCFPMITMISNDLLSLEGKLFHNTSGELVREILRVRSNILTFRKTMQGHDATIERLLTRGEKLFSVEALRSEYDDIRAHGREMRDFLNNDKDTVDALYDSHLSLISHHTGEEIKTLTALAFIIFPMTLVAAIFAMRAEHMPFVGMPNDFWIMIGIIFGTMVALVLLLKAKKWL